MHLATLLSFLTPILLLTLSVTATTVTKTLRSSSSTIPGRSTATTVSTVTEPPNKIPWATITISTEDFHEVNVTRSVGALFPEEEAEVLSATTLEFAHVVEAKRRTGRISGGEMSLVVEEGEGY
jgi:hypothetical protein